MFPNPGDPGAPRREVSPSPLFPQGAGEGAETILLRDPWFEAGVISGGVLEGKTALGGRRHREMAVLGGEGHWEMGRSGFGGLLEDSFLLEQWVVTVGCPALRGALSAPHHHPQMPGPFPVQLPHAGSWTDAGEGGWIRAGGRGDSVPGLGLLPGLVSLPSLALPWGLSGRQGKEESWRDKSAPHLPQLHPGLTTPQRKMKIAVLSVALLFTVLLCTPEDAQVSPQCHEEGLQPGDGSWLQDISSPAE